MKNTRYAIFLASFIALLSFTACGEVGDKPAPKTTKADSSSFIDSSSVVDSKQDDSSSSDSKTTTTASSKETTSVTTTSIVVLKDGKGNIVTQFAVDESGRTISLGKDSKTTTKKSGSGSSSSGKTSTKKTSNGSSNNTTGSVTYQTNSGGSSGYSNGDSGYSDNGGYSYDDGGNSGSSGGSSGGSGSSGGGAVNTTTTTTTTRAPEDSIPKGYYGKSGIYYKTREETIASWPSDWDSFENFQNQTRMMNIIDGFSIHNAYDLIDYLLMDCFDDPHNADYYRNIGNNLDNDGTDYGKAKAVYEWQANNVPEFKNCVYHAAMTQALCEGIGLECTMASRLDSGVWGITNEDFYYSHVANVVYIDDMWYILEPTFAAKYHGSITLYGMDDYKESTSSDYNDNSFVRFIDRYENIIDGINICNHNYS